MTAQEWRRCRDPRRMLEAFAAASALLPPHGDVNVASEQSAITAEKLQEEMDAICDGRPPHRHAVERKYFLFIAGCYRRIESLLIPEAKRLLELHEADADGPLRPRQEANARQKLEAAMKMPPPDRDGRGRARAAAEEAAGWLLHGIHDTNHEAVFDAIAETVWRDPEYAGGPEGEGPHQADLLRDIYGTPCGQVQFEKAWRTDTAIALATQVYDSRDFGAMPILADALQDAGCDNEAILSHCRDATLTHVRGCWVVDLVLGKA